MSGPTLGASETSVSALERLSVSIDPYALEGGAGRTKLKSINQDGTLSYEEGCVGRAPDAKFTETLGRIWNEYPGGMLDITEDSIMSKDLDALAVEQSEPEGEKGTEVAKGDIMAWEDMEKLRQDVLFQLNSSRNELWYVLELAKTLSLSSSFTADPPPPPSFAPVPIPPKKNRKDANAPNGSGAGSSKSGSAVPVPQEDPPVLPPGTFTTVSTAAPLRTLQEEVMDLEIALASKQAALQDCSDLIDSAVEELTSMGEASDKFWDNVNKLKHGRGGRSQWALVPKPDFGRVSGEGDKAKDLVIPYALDEAPLSTRTRCLAAFDLDPKKDPLAFGVRTNSRLRLTFTDHLGMSSSSSLPSRSEDPSEVERRIGEAQLEAFDEDLFGEIRSEMARRGTGTIEPRSVTLSVGDQKLSFELILPDDSQPTETGGGSPLPEILLSMTRQSLLQLYRSRKRQLISPAKTGAFRPRSLLAPIIHLIQYLRMVEQITSALEGIHRTITGAGVKSRVVKRMSLEASAISDILAEGGNMDRIGGVFSLHLAGGQGVSFNTAAPSSITATTSQATFPLFDTSDLVSIVSTDIAVQLTGICAAHIRSALREGEGDSGTLFVDELENSLYLPNGPSLRISIPPPFDAVKVQVWSETDAPEPYDSRSGVTLQDWLAKLVN